MKAIDRLCAKTLAASALKQKSAIHVWAKAGGKPFVVSAEEFMPAEKQLEIWRKTYNEKTL